jgi:hypothetical protein
MTSEFEMSMIGELSYFLSLQIKQLKNSTFVSQCKYIKDILKKFRMEDAKAISTLLVFINLTLVLDSHILITYTSNFIISGCHPRR